MSELERFLGPTGDELGCDACFELLDEFVELELAGADAAARVPGMQEHLVGCPACREEHESLRALVQAERSSSSWADALASIIDGQRSASSTTSRPCQARRRSFTPASSSANL